ncbi:MAG TPA: phosphoglycolate phosphatase [Bauldia sp.]|nr:phosphoglycolate phosphatase [Bauldia sp.]
MTRPTIVFDLDGTLVDTADDLVATLNAVLVSEGMVPVSRDRLIGMVGSGARVLLEAAFAAEGRALTPAKLDALLARFMAYYDAHIADSSRPYPGAEAMLARFAADGWLLAVCTNKYEAPARKLLAILGLADRFAAITGQDTFGFRKPDPRHLTETVRLAGGDPGDAVMVGDSATDIDTAKAAGVPVVAVSFGYSPVPVSRLGPTRVVGSLADLPAAVAEMRVP